MPNLTITDQLLLTGADLNLTDDMIADSVIINCEEIHQASIVDDEVIDTSERATKPPFKNAFYEFKIVKTPIIIHLSKVTKSQILEYLSDTLDTNNTNNKELRTQSTADWLDTIKNDELLYLMNMITETGSESVTVLRFGENDQFIATQGLFFRGADGYSAAQTDKIITDFNQMFLVLLLNANYHIHSKGDVEFKDWTSRQRRATKSRFKKEPSPYFLLKVGHQNQIRYNNKPDDAFKSNTKRRAHIVRGHFRTVEDHPIEHFNGTFWIEPHKRGDSENGDINKGYKVRTE